MKKYFLLLTFILIGCNEHESSGSVDEFEKKSDQIKNQQDLVNFLSDTKYLSEEKYTTGEVCNEKDDGSWGCNFTYDYWSLSFTESVLYWRTHDQIDVVLYSYISPEEFQINLSYTSLIANIDPEEGIIVIEDVTYLLDDLE